VFEFVFIIVYNLVGYVALRHLHTILSLILTNSEGRKLLSHFSLIGCLRRVQSRRKPLPRSRSSSLHVYVRKVSRISLFHLLVTSINLVDQYRKSFFNPATSSSLTALVAVATPVINSKMSSIKPTSITCFHQSRTGSGPGANIRPIVDLGRIGRASRRIFGSIARGV
jgi:hypothetical protein